MTKQAQAAPAPAPTAVEEQIEITDEEPADDESKWKPYLIYGGVAAGIVGAATVVTLLLRR